LRKSEIDGHKRAFCPECSWIQYENPLPCVAAFVQNDQGEILLVKRGVVPAKGKWALPSGFIEIDETPEEACLRELEEETGLNGRIRGLLGVFNQKSFLYKNVLIIGYEVQATGAICPGSDSSEAVFFSPENLPEIAFPSHQEIVLSALKARRP
jgi:8-oxo-dGTP diphosphatase